MSETLAGGRADGAGANIPVSVLRYGAVEPLPQATPLRAGPVSALFEGGDLRYLRVGDKEIVRRIYVAVRDHNWDTIPGTIHDLQIDARNDSFAVTFTMVHNQGGIHFTWEGEIRGRPSGQITFGMNGQSLSAFRRNRIGICVLHPGAVAGATCRVEHAGVAEGDDAASIPPTESCFPQDISPHQPFMDIRAITHVVEQRDGETVEAEVRFDGDVFEMEDQRNWTDASFKTYSTPLAIPYPVDVLVGDLVEQRVEVKVLTQSGRSVADLYGRASQQADATMPIVLTLGAGDRVPMPRIGLGSARHGEALSANEINRLRDLNPAHLRVDLYPQSRVFVHDLQDAWRAAAFLGASLEVGLFLSAEAATELAYVARATGEFNPDIVRWLIYRQGEPSTAAAWAEMARDTLKPITPGAAFVAGTNAYFTELNRGRPPVEVADGVVYSINPQVHAFDLRSLVETLETQGTTVTSARAFAAGLPVYVSPVTLRPRFNPNATGPEPEPAPGELPSAVDPRQMSLFGAGWTLGSLKYLAEAGVAAVTYYQTTGDEGVMAQESGSLFSHAFRSISGGVYPLYHVLADIGEVGGAVIPLGSSNSLEADGMALVGPDGRLCILVANFSPAVQSLRLQQLAGTRAQVRVLDESNVLTAMATPEQYRETASQVMTIADGMLDLELAPFAVARVDVL